MLDLTQIVSTFVGSLLSIAVAYVSFKFFRNKVKKGIFDLRDQKEELKFTSFIFDNSERIFTLGLI